MSIAIIGPEKFAFQDMVCIELALGYRHDLKVELIPEPTGGEDANFVWPGKTPLTLEVQVKGAKGSAGVAQLADYLVHYPSREASGSLAERLFDVVGQHALFVLTARCDDSIAPLLISSILNRPTNRPAPRTVAKALRDEFVRLGEAKPSKGATELALMRSKNIAALAKRPISDFERLLAKTTISDQQTAEKVEVRLHSTLRSERFDTFSLRGILAKLSDILNVCKWTQTDALTPMRDELFNSAPNAVRPEGYIERGAEAGLLSELSKKCVLLLTGAPRIGKSWTARSICGELQARGYEARQGSYIEEADRFLNDATGAERVYVLDDPLGSRETVHDANARMSALQALTDRIPSNRRLIVAQTEQVLLQVRGTQRLASCALGNHAWHRLGPLQIENAKSIWQTAATIQRLLPQAIVKVNDLIEREPNLRDPGALVFLAQTWDELDARSTDEEILMQSRRDAQDFARSLAERIPSMRDLLTASAIATTAVEGTIDTELAFIIDGDTDRPSVQDANRIITLGVQQDKAPSYSKTPIVTPNQKLALETLKRKRVVEEHARGLNFSHPYLRAGAQALIAPEIPEDKQRILEQIGRAIASCSPVTSLAAARNLHWLRHASASQSSDAIYDVARLGVQSVFPATRDTCYKFLIESADALPKEFLEELPRWSEHTLISLSDINVVEGIGFIASQRNWEIEFLGHSLLSEIMPYLDAIEAEAPLALDLALSRRFLLTLRDHPLALTPKAVRRFLSADEAVVRASAAGIWCSVQRDDDVDIIQRLESDSTPAVSIRILRELSGQWQNLDDLRREQLIAVLLRHASSPGCASVLLDRLVLFNRVEHFGEDPPWQIFTELMPIVISHLPLSVSFANGRFDAVIGSALEKAGNGTVSSTIIAWAERLFQRLDHYMLDEYELAIVDPLLDGVNLTSRLPILETLLNVRDTGAKILTVKWLAKRWSELDGSERALLKEAILLVRPDAIWLAATILTLSNPPDELVLAITGDANLLSDDVEEIEQVLGEQLFSACVRMYVGNPQPLWWYATHHSSNPSWADIIRYLANTPEHALHEIGFYELADFGEPGELEELIGYLPESELPKVFKRLLDFKIAHVGDWRSDAWRCLFARVEVAGLEKSFFKKIDAALEGILEHCTDVRHWVGQGPFEARIYDLLPNDFLSLVRLKDLKKMHQTMQDAKAIVEDVDEDLLGAVFAAFCAKELLEFEAKPPRIFGTWTEISNVFSMLGADKETLAKVEARRSEAVKKHNDIRKGARGGPPLVDLLGWAHQTQQS